jgi:hypothetical protein
LPKEPDVTTQQHGAARKAADKEVRVVSNYSKPSLISH